MRLTRIFFRRAEELSVITRDVVRLKMVGGHGGYGLPRYNGVGGNGGSVYLRVNEQLTFDHFVNQFEEMPRLIKAENGENSQQVKLAAMHGAHKFLEVPYGVECVDESSKLLARCVNARRMYLIARGGQGGSASNNYLRTLGESFSVAIHLKLRLNVGFLGFPNAGKSTLLKALVPEKSVKIANYPFTTLKPQLCYLKVASDEPKDGERPKLEDELKANKYAYKEPPFTMSVADLPGIIEGASRNRGVGHAFLKHLEYSEIIAVVVDVHGFQLNASLNEPYRTALETVALLNREAETYSIKLLNKKFVLILNKIDVMDGEQKAAELVKLFLGESRQERLRWVNDVPADLRPRRPIAFDATVCVSAKLGELGDLVNVFCAIHERLHQPKRVVFPEEVEERNRNILV